MYLGSELISDKGGLLQGLASLAWPALVAGIVWHFGGEIKRLLERVAEIKLNKGEGQVDILLQNNLETAKASLPPKHVEEVRIGLEKQGEHPTDTGEPISETVHRQAFARLSRVADTDPRGAVLESALLTRKILLEATEAKGFKKESSSPTNHPLLAEAYLLNKGYISDEAYTAITSLTRFRANLESMPDFQPRAHYAKEFIVLLAALAAKFDQVKAGGA
jgi:hypothetical protein